MGRFSTTECTYLPTYLAIVAHFSAKTDFFSVRAALQPPICCSNTTANTF